MAYLAISHVCLYIEELIQFTVQLVYVSDKLKDKCLTVIYENFANILVFGILVCIKSIKYAFFTET